MRFRRGRRVRYGRARRVFGGRRSRRGRAGGRVLKIGYRM